MTIKRWLEYLGNRTRNGRRRKFNQVSGEIVTQQKMTAQEAVNEGLALHDMWRTMGYTPDEIFVSLSEPLKAPPEVVGLTQVMLVLQKDKDSDPLFQYHIAFLEMGRETFMPMWTEAVESWNTKMTFEERRDLVYSTTVRRNAVMLMTAMQVKGLKVSATLV